MNAEEQAAREALLREYDAKITAAFNAPGFTLSEMEDAVTEVGKAMNHALLEKMIAIKKRVPSCPRVRSVGER